MRETTNTRRNLQAGTARLAAFALWTALIQLVDVRPVEQNGTDIGFAMFNVWFHGLTGVHPKVIGVQFLSQPQSWQTRRVMPGHPGMGNTLMA